MTLHNYRSTTAYDDHRGPEPDEDAPRVEVGPINDEDIIDLARRFDNRRSTGGFLHYDFDRVGFARALLSRYGAACVEVGEPVAWLKDDGSDAWTDAKKRLAEQHAGTPGALVASRYSLPLFAAPQPTDEEIRNQALEALKNARQFIINGIDLGFILMPDPNTPDSAHDTLPEIEAAIRALKSNPAEVKE